jgi:hypothetical protein
MAKVPSLPSTGQPIDTQYIYDIVSSLIDINKELVSSGNSTVKVQNQVKTVKKTSNINFDAQQVTVVSADRVTKSVARQGQIAFNTNFTQVPVVTATLVAKDVSSVNATITITNVDINAVYYKIIFDSDGTTTLDANIIAIGA